MTGKVRGVWDEAKWDDVLFDDSSVPIFRTSLSDTYSKLNKAITIIISLQSNTIDVGSSDRLRSGFDEAHWDASLFDSGSSTVKTKSEDITSKSNNKDTIVKLAMA